MKISITEATKGPFKRFTIWEGKQVDYLAQDCIVNLDEFQTVVWEYRLNNEVDALAVGEYQIDLNSFQTKKFNNAQGDVLSYGVNRPEFKNLRLKPVYSKISKG